MIGPVPSGQAIRWTVKKIRAMDAGQRAALAIDQVQRKTSLLQRRLPSRPSVLWIEPTNRCNLNCLMCERDDLQRPLADLQWPLFESIAEDAARFGIRRIKLNRFGEPLLHREIHRMTAVLKSLKIPWVFFATNGTLLDAAAREAILESGLDLLIVSIDGVTRETYERIRRGSRFEVVRHNVEEMIQLRNRRRQERPLIQVNAVLMQENRREMPQLLQYWSTRADFVNILSYNTISANEHSLLDDANYSGEQIPCDFMNSSMFVLVNGEVTLCCVDHNGKLSAGKIGSQTLQEIWNGDRYQRIRALQAERRFEELPHCRSCVFIQQERRQALFRQNHEVYRAAQKVAK